MNKFAQPRATQSNSQIQSFRRASRPDSRLAARPAHLNHTHQTNAAAGSMSVADDALAADAFAEAAAAEAECARRPVRSADVAGQWMPAVEHKGALRASRIDAPRRNPRCCVRQRCKVLARSISTTALGSCFASFREKMRQQWLFCDASKFAGRIALTCDHYPKRHPISQRR